MSLGQIAAAMEVVRILPASTLSRFGSVTNSIRMVPSLNRTVQTDEPGHPTLRHVEFNLVDGRRSPKFLVRPAVRIEAMCLPSHLDLRPVGFDEVWHRR